MKIQKEKLKYDVDGFESYDQYPFLTHIQQEPEDKFLCKRYNYRFSRNAMMNVCFNKKSCGDCIKQKEKENE